VSVPEIDVDGLEAQRAAGAVVIDVRETDELEEARVPGVVHLPLGEVVARVGEVPTDQTVYVICRSGGRSAQAVEFMLGQGIDAVNVAGGTLAWMAAGKETESG